MRVSHNNGPTNYSNQMDPSQQQQQQKQRKMSNIFIIAVICLMLFIKGKYLPSYSAIPHIFAMKAKSFGAPAHTKKLERKKIRRSPTICGMSANK